MIQNRAILCRVPNFKFNQMGRTVAFDSGRRKIDLINSGALS